MLKEMDREAASTSYMWAYRSSENSDEPIVLLAYQPGRGQIHPQAFLGDYRGIVMSDGYSAWRTLEGATHLGCMAHSRRRFVDALKARTGRRNRRSGSSNSSTGLKGRRGTDTGEG
ncbi:hypothetical protein MesoLj113b_63730 [Mesorhizobium sp. 113-3-3]|nr:hypothetical protein MesoLj113b_63730 [Mesorhizobium sp. 113-3-3]BCG90707.1 hypothetical protein MesoLj113c_68170 [Mesorhizobium sp. 113-3-9]